MEGLSQSVERLTLCPRGEVTSVVRFTWKRLFTMTGRSRKVDAVARRELMTERCSPGPTKNSIVPLPLDIFLSSHSGTIPRPGTLCTLYLTAGTKALTMSRTLVTTASLYLCVDPLR